MSAQVQVVFYSMYGHVYRMAEAVAEGARSVPGVEVVLRQVPETLPAEALAKMGAVEARKAFAHVPVAEVDSLPEADAIIFGTPTRFGNMCAQMRAFLDRTGGLWAKGALIGKVGQRLREHGHAARRPRDDDHEFSHDAAASRHAGRGLPVLRAGTYEHGRDHRRQSVRGGDAGGRRRLAAAFFERTRHRPFPRGARGEDRAEAQGVVRCKRS